MTPFGAEDLLPVAKRSPSGAKVVYEAVPGKPFKGVNFANSSYLYPVGPGQNNVVKILYTGSRLRDFKAANIAAGIGNTSKPPPGYVWHHLHDYNPATNAGTMQLVRRSAHEATYPHTGGVAQYEAAWVPYDLPDAARASIRAAGMYVPGE